MFKKDKELKQELIRHISMIMIGILCIPVIAIFILMQQSIQYNSLYKENIGKQTERIAVNMSNEIQRNLDEYIQILDILPYIKDQSKYMELYNLIHVEEIYYYKNEIDKKKKMKKINIKSLRKGINIIATFYGGKIIIDQSKNSKEDGYIYIFGEDLLKKIIGENKITKMIMFDQDKKLIYNSDFLEKDTMKKQIIESRKFNNFLEEKIWNHTGYTYYDPYGKYGKQTIVSYASLKDSISLKTIGSVVVFRETSKLIPDEKNSNIVLFIAMFIGGTILIKLIFKFSEIIIAQFMKITESFNKASKEKEVMRKKLLISEKLASLGRITSGIAHEIGNPLSAILSTSQILMSYDLSKEKTREFVSKIQNDALRIDSLIKEFLYFHRDKKGNYIFININDVLENAIDAIPDNRKSKNVELYKEFSKNLPDIFADNKKLEMAFTNVILNSFQEIKDGGMIHIRTTKQNSMICIKIKDTGKGIAKNDIEKIFDPFYTTKEVGQGFGLGLFICQQIIEVHNGNIEILSEENNGTEFIIRLPFSENEGEKTNDTQNSYR